MLATFILCACLASEPANKEPTMSEVAQAAILEATEYHIPAPTGDMFRDWQRAVLEAVADTEEEAACVREGGTFKKMFGEEHCE